MQLPQTEVFLDELHIPNFDFSIYREGESIYIALEDLLYATLLEDGITTQLLGLMEPPEGYSSLIDIKEYYQACQLNESHVILCKVPFIEIHGALALMRIALQERPENIEVKDIIKAMKEEYNLTRKDDEIVDYILSNPWLQRLG